MINARHGQKKIQDDVSTTLQLRSKYVFKFKAFWSFVVLRDCDDSGGAVLWFAFSIGIGLGKEGGRKGGALTWWLTQGQADHLDWDL